jgi:hypothetical protein
MISVLEILQWFEYSSLLVAMRSSPWLFPVIATFHLFGLVLLGSAVLIVDLRLLGLGLTGHSAAELAKGTDPLLLGGLVVMFVSGVPLLMCFGTKYYYLPAFWVKLLALSLAIALASSVHRRVINSDIVAHGTWSSRSVGLLSLALWSCVMLCGRLIGFP